MSDPHNDYRNGPRNDPRRRSHSGERISAPAPPAPDPRQQERSRARAERTRRRRTRERRIPTWARDFGHWMLAGGFATVLGIVLILCVRWRILIDDRGQVVDSADVWAGLTPMLCGLMWPCFILSFQRSDQGFRREGLVRLSALAVPLFVLMQVAALLLWPWLIGPDLQVGTVLADLASEPTALLTGAAISATATALFTALVMVFSAGGVVAALICLLPFLGAVLGLGFYSAHTLTHPTSVVHLAVWTALAVISYGACLGASALVTHLRRNDPAGH